MIQLQITGRILPRPIALRAEEAGGAAWELVLGARHEGAALFTGGRRVAHVSRTGWLEWTLFQDDVPRARLQPRLFGSLMGQIRSWRDLRARVLETVLDDGRPHVLFEAHANDGRYEITRSRDNWETRILAPGGATMARLQRGPTGFLLDVEPGADRFVALGLTLFLLKRAQIDEYDRQSADRHRTTSHVIVNPWPGNPPRRQPRRPPDRREPPVTWPPVPFPGFPWPRPGKQRDRWRVLPVDPESARTSEDPPSASEPSEASEPDRPGAASHGL